MLLGCEVLVKLLYLEEAQSGSPFCNFGWTVLMYAHNTEWAVEVLSWNYW